MIADLQPQAGSGRVTAIPGHVINARLRALRDVCAVLARANEAVSPLPTAT
jgi:hypothetical protein